MGLPMKTSKFTVFTEDDYNAVYNTLVNKTIKVLKDTDAETPEELPLNRIKVDYIK